jgi:hypothetical protein
MDPRHVKEVMEQASLAPEAEKADAAARHQTAALLWANAPVVVGVAFFGWRMYEVVYMYWLDSMVLGLFTFLRVLRCEPDRPQDKPMAAGMFLLMFTVTLLFFQMFIRPFFAPPGTVDTNLGATMAQLFSERGMFLGFLVMLGFHGAAFVAYLFAGKFRVKEPRDVTGEAGTRITVLMMYITLGVFVYQGLGSPLLAAVLFVGVKVFYDLKRYREEGSGLGKSGVTE